MQSPETAVRLLFNQGSLARERVERTKSGRPESMTCSSGQCQEAVHDPVFFHQCPQ